jgi:hypothetical protein
MEIMQIVQIVVGLALLAFGRKGLGLLLGAIGFFAGMSLVTHFVAMPSPGVVFGAALVGGMIGVFIAFFIQKIAVAVAGLLGGGYIGYLVSGTDGISRFPGSVIIWVIGILLAFFIPKWALIIWLRLCAFLLCGDTVRNTRHHPFLRAPWRGNPVSASFGQITEERMTLQTFLTRPMEDV